MKRTISRFLDPRPLAAYCSRLTAHCLLLTAYCLLLTFPGCGDDKKDGGSSSGGSAKARVEATFEEWQFIRCEVDQACPAPVFDSLEQCQRIAASDANSLRKLELGYMARFPECYPTIVDSYEACKSVVEGQTASSLCQYYDRGFYRGKEKKGVDIYEAFPECGKVLKDIQQAQLECGLDAVAFLGAAPRSRLAKE